MPIKTPVKKTANHIATSKFVEGVYAQIDGMLENGEQAVAVEVKTTLRQADMDDHLVRMEKIRKYADEYGGKRQFGAMAATIADVSSREYALKKGLFVIEPSRGGTFAALRLGGGYRR
jgi:hypothetical protein